MVAKSHFSAVLSLATSVACFASPPVAVPAARAVSVRSVPTSWSLPHRVSIGEANNRRTPNIVERLPQQIPFQWCPEFFGNPPKLCSNCGGDTKVKGTCDEILLSGRQNNCNLVSPYYGCYGYFCKCSDSGGPDNSPKVTSTTVVDGNTGTAVWEPLTLTEYKNLRASTTVTLTETATATGNSEVETVVAVIFAGGVAWWLASQSGAAGVALALQPPASRPEGSRDDDTACKSNPKEQCSNCGGADELGLCKSGSEAGCPCDEGKQECPTDTPPKCSATDCSGDDNTLECKADGNLKGCQCCPDTANCNTADCKSKDQLTCSGPKLSKCPCQIPDIKATPVLDPFNQPLPNSDEETSAAAAVFTTIWGADYSKVPGYLAATTSTSPYCLHGAAPNQPRVPQDYCQCGSSYATTYSIVTTGTDPCPFNPTSTGQLVTFSTPSPTPSPTNPPPTTAPPATTQPPPATTTSSYPCSLFWCGALVCNPSCQPPPTTSATATTSSKPCTLYWCGALDCSPSCQP